MDPFSYDPYRGRTPDEPAAQRDAQRHAARDSLFLVATLRIGMGEVQVRVRNLSEGGLMAEYAEPVETGAPVEVDLRGIGWTRGRVAWSAEKRIGIAFDRSIDPKLARKPVGNGTTTPIYAKPHLFRG